MPPAPRELRLAALLRDLGARVRQGASPEAPLPRCPTGLPDLDRLLGGGFPRGGVSEVAGPASSGRTSLVLALLARATERGEATALVDVGDALDPPSAAAAGVELTRLLWVRPPDVSAALRGTSHLLAARGFATVVLDLVGLGERAAHGIRVWPRLRRETAATDTALVVVSERRVVQGFADLALDLGPAVPRFEGAFLLSLESEALLVRDRRGGEPRSVALRSAGRLRAARTAAGAAS
jgi:RecA/RadA recombinase